MKDESMIDVWKIEYQGKTWYSNEEPEPSDPSIGRVVTKEQMHRDLYWNIPTYGELPDAGR